MVPKRGEFSPSSSQSFKRHLSSTFEEKCRESECLCVRFLGCKWKSRQTCGLVPAPSKQGAAGLPSTRAHRGLRCPECGRPSPNILGSKARQPGLKAPHGGARGLSAIGHRRNLSVKRCHQMREARSGVPLLISPQRVRETMQSTSKR